MAAPASIPCEAGTALELTSAGDVETLVRARGTRFVVTNRIGNIAPSGARELGLYADDTRFLSHYELGIEGEALVHLSSDAFDPAANQIDLMVSGDGKLLDDPRNFLHVQRRQLVDDGFCDEITFVNYREHRLDLTVSFTFAADFADVFEVRGHARSRRGVFLDPILGDDSVELRYRGLDGRCYATHVSIAPAPSFIGERRIDVAISIEPGASRVVELRATPRVGPARAPVRERPFDELTRLARDRTERFREESTRFRCDNAILQNVLDQASSDLLALAVEIGGDRVLAAGIPWFSCPFGRDTLIAAYEALLLNPELAVSSLRVLARFQGRAFDDFTEEEPGKIFHELRFGEMAVSKEIPHSPYYGSIDSTPLFVIVLDATYRVTADDVLLRELRPSLEAALAWIDRRSEDGSRLVTYERRSPRGLDNQGWKDSRAGVPYPDGRHAAPPIALCEVQGYCIDAYRRGARLLRALGDDDAARTYESRVVRMTELVDRVMWLSELERYAYAVDGDGGLLPTVVSNLGHLLWSRVPTPERARLIADLLVAPASLAAFGVRTLAAGQPVYNPLSYHNGTIWPHDNAIVAKGLANYDLMDHACRVFEALARAMGMLHDRRLPELYCGMSQAGGTLVRYPVACSPQAWAAAAPFLLLQSVLGIHINGPRRRLEIRNPQMPPTMSRVDIDGLRVGASRVSLRIRRVGKHCHIDRLDVAGPPIRIESVVE